MTEGTYLDHRFVGSQARQKIQMTLFEEYRESPEKTVISSLWVEVSEWQ